MIKRIEIIYRGIFQKTLAKRLGGDIVVIATRMGKVGFSNGRYSDSPERNGIPCKYFAFISADLAEEELEAECGAKLDIDEAAVSVVLDDTLVRGMESWGWSGIRAINEKVVEGGSVIVVSRRENADLLRFIAQKPFVYNLATINGDASFSGMWVFNDDLTHERVLGAIAAVDPAIITVDAVETYLRDKTHDERRVQAARTAYDEALEKTILVQPEHGAKWEHTIPHLPAWREFREGAVVPAVPRGFRIGPRGQSRNPQFKRGTTKTQRPVVRFDLCTKCTLCWLECPDECFDPTPDGYYDVDYQYCVGCGKCAEVCPVGECLVMVDELRFENEESPWEAWKRTPSAYVEQMEQKKGASRIVYPRVTGKGMSFLAGQAPPEGGKRAGSREKRQEGAS
jgi:pyruvate ferredoxin oxidoreductase delta subunit